MTEPKTIECPFCTIGDGPVLLRSESAMAILDRFPVSPGHTLVISRRHVGRLGDLNDEEQMALWNMVRRVQGMLIEEQKPDGFNIGLNDGAAAGQTIPHVHIHVIPRYDGDVPDPRGGIRWVIANKAAYWE